MMEAITGVAGAVGPQRVRPGPRDTAMREARVCYDHLAGELAVAMLDGLVAHGVLVTTGDALAARRRRRTPSSPSAASSSARWRAAPAALPRLPRLERAPLASRRRAGRGDPRQGARWKDGRGARTAAACWCSRRRGGRRFAAPSSPRRRCRPAEPVPRRGRHCRVGARRRAPSIAARALPASLMKRTTRRPAG